MMFYLILECLLVIMVMYMLFFLVFYKIKKDTESSSPYECGFDPYSSTRMSFSYRFFLISILFMIFDVEISLMLPFPFLMNKVMAVWLFILFIMVLIIGLIYEYNQGSLDWLDNFVSKA